MQLFSADATMFSIFFFFFDHKKLKKPPQKVAHNRPRPFFFSAAPTAQNSPELHFRFINSFIQSSLLRSLLKVSKFRKQIMVSKLLPKNKPNSLSWKITTSRLIQKESLCSFCKKINSLLY